MRALMTAADVYCMPSFEEPFGMVFVEAMGLAKPVVALDIGGSKEIVVDGSTGFLTAPGDTAGLSERLVRLLVDPDLRRSMGEAGHRRVMEEYSGERLAHNVAAVYDHLLAR